MDLQTVETALVDALKSRNQLAADALRALKTRIQNEQIAKGGALSEDDLLKLVQSEVKKRKEAAESFASAGRTESAEKEEAEIAVLSVFMPPQASEAEIISAIDEAIASSGWTAKDFGQAMGAIKAKFGSSADGALIAKLLKDKLS